MDIKIKFGNKVRMFRQNLGLSQEKLAEICSLHRTYIGNVERGEKNLSLENIEKIAKGLKVEIKDLFDNL